MLKDVVRAIDRGEVSRREKLAAKIGIGVSSIDGVLDFLVKMEYLKVIDGVQTVDKCNCGHCSKNASVQ